MLLGRAFSASGYKTGLLAGSGATGRDNSSISPTGSAAKDKHDAPIGVTRDSNGVSSAGGPGSQVQPAAGQTAAQAQQPQKACVGDLLKPFVIYLQVRDKLEQCSGDRCLVLLVLLVLLLWIELHYRVWKHLLQSQGWMPSFAKS
jgi:hypothetical protein